MKSRRKTILDIRLRKLVESMQMSELSEVKSGRIRVWKSLKRIRRIGRAKHRCILEPDKVAKTWALRRDDFTFLI